MANPEHLKILKQGVEVWNQWQEKFPDEHPNLRSANLKKINLVGANFRGTDIHGTNFMHANRSGLS